jgi:hypothetical protein
MPKTKHLVVASLAAGTVAITGAGAALAATSSSTHTLSFVSNQTSATMHFGPHFVNADKDVKGGHVIGDDVLSAKVTYTKKVHSITGSIAIALNGGEIYATITGNPDTNKLSGTLTGGAGKYAGISGTISGNAVGKDGAGEHLVVKYH